MIRFSTTSRPDSDAPLAVFVHPSGAVLRQIPSSLTLPSSLLTTAREDGFEGKTGGSFLLRNPSGQPSSRLLLLSVGTGAANDPAVYRHCAASAARRAKDAGWETLSILIPSNIKDPGLILQAVTEGILLGSYSYTKYKNVSKPSKSLQNVAFVVPSRLNPRRAQGNIQRGSIAADSVIYARDLINESPSQKTPDTLAGLARGLACPSIQVNVFGKKDLLRMKMMVLLGVNRGSAHPPAFVHLHYRPKTKARKRLAIVGKGITFDSGGLSLKPADSMTTMKSDMSGAAAVMAVFKALPLLKPAVEIHGLIPLTENMPGDDACKPGDVLQAMNGKTIEVLNTDAEGRLILADALSYASTLTVDEIVDVATLTGACTIALGREYAALLGNDTALKNRLKEASRLSGEKVWELPLEKNYRDHILSDVADLKNMGNPGEAGTIIGGVFLQEFIGQKKWAHIDIASVSWTKKGNALCPPGGTGVMVRTILNYILGRTA
ncbi:MAG TPA: leucyl aminopeptidase [Elusimicrobiota bacterium]|nr:leucyl aminopeptidase [Elusimicrobiota bacterium]